MFARNWLTFTVIGACCFPCLAPLLAADSPPGDVSPANSSPATLTVGQEVKRVAQEARDALVVFNVADRDGQEKGIGTGFFVSDDGLIATNLHVIGEGRPFTIELAGGEQATVREVHATDRHLDLAIVRVDVPERGWKHLELGDSAKLDEGSPIVVMGNPFGLKSSVVSGVLSGRRDVEGRSMLQIAVPVEPGNSGGPVLDMTGRVQGVVTMKSLVTNNLGFAIESRAVASLLERPNPVPMDRWITIGALDTRHWTIKFGAQWRQQAGEITVAGQGDGFGGRALCLANDLPRDMPFELATDVKLDDEAGAAGLVFHADGQDRHYGFYPSNGQLRFSCFEGPSVFQWRVLRESSSEHYRSGEWNRLRIRVEPGRMRCYVNEHLVFDVNDGTLEKGMVGLAKFRDTKAQFRRFQVGESLEPPTLDERQQQQFKEALAGLSATTEFEATTSSLLSLRELGAPAPAMLEQQARQLQRQAAAYLKAAEEVRLQLVLGQLEELLSANDLNLLQGALLIAKLDNDELDIRPYARAVEQMAEEIREQLDPAATAEDRLKALNRYLFEENGFHGSRHDYYHRANSYLNRVIDDREGIPITLSVLYLELGHRLELNLEGVGLPGHFVVRWRDDEGAERLIDVFDGAHFIDREKAAELARLHGGERLSDRHLQAVPPRDILQRMLGNLVGIAQRDRNSPTLRRYLEAMVRVAPDAIQYRGMRAIARFEAGHAAAALDDLDWFLEHEPEEIDLNRIRELRQLFERQRRPD